MYIYEQEEWPNFIWDQEKLSDLLADVRFLQGKLIGQMQGYGFHFGKEATFNVLTQDALNTSEIEGEKLNVEQVRSSIAKKMGLDIGKTCRVDRNIEGLVEILLDATRNYNLPLTKERLFKWHSLLFPNGHSGIDPIIVGNWRNKLCGAMQIVSGPIGREVVHYVAPKFNRVAIEMRRLIRWINKESEMDLIIKSALAHFWFVTIHPFEDGNGRIGRAIADMLLARSEQSAQRFYSLSSQILKERNKYYDVLGNCQKGSLDVSEWIEWYLKCLRSAILASKTTLELILGKARFWKLHENQDFNERQRQVLNRFLGEFVGKLTSSKWAKIAKCSQDTALRDINDLLEKKILIKEESGGRSTSYNFCGE